MIHALLTMTMVINQRCWQAAVPVPMYHAVSFLNIDPPPPHLSPLLTVGLPIMHTMPSDLGVLFDLGLALRLGSWL